MNNQVTPVEYCRHENCKREIEPCSCIEGFCRYKGWTHAKRFSHYCNTLCETVAEPADPPQQPKGSSGHFHSGGGLEGIWATYRVEICSICPPTDPRRHKVKAGTQMEERKPDDSVRFVFECGCQITIWAQFDKVKSGLSCCSMHEAYGQTLSNILSKCPLLLTRFVKWANAPSENV